MARATDELNISMTTVVSNSAALVPAWLGPPRSWETLHHLLPFFFGLACLVKKVHCADVLRINAHDLKCRGKQMVCGTFFLDSLFLILFIYGKWNFTWSDMNAGGSFRLKSFLDIVSKYCCISLLVVSMLLSIEFLRWEFVMLWDTQLKFWSCPLYFSGGRILKARHLTFSVTIKLQIQCLSGESYVGKFFLLIKTIQRQIN